MKVPERLLLGPGPSPVSPRVMQALGSPIVSHLDPAMMALLDDLRARLGWAFGADSNAFSFAVSGTGTVRDGDRDRECDPARCACPCRGQRVFRGSAGADPGALRRRGLPPGRGVGPCLRSGPGRTGAEGERRGHRCGGARRNVDRCRESGGRDRGAGQAARRDHHCRCGHDGRRCSGADGRVGRGCLLQLHPERPWRAVGPRAGDVLAPHHGGTRPVAQLLPGRRTARGLLGPPQIPSHALRAAHLRAARRARRSRKRRGSTRGGRAIVGTISRSLPASRGWACRCCLPSASGCGR